VFRVWNIGASLARWLECHIHCKRHTDQWPGTL